MNGELLTRWTARAVVACWATRVLVEVSGTSPRRDAAARWAWTVGCGAYLVHVAAAFAFYHNWSHEAAWEHTARRTVETVGLDWGGGVYFNYLAAVLWPLDVALAWWNRRKNNATATASRARIFHRLNFAFVTFLIVNATVVFGPAFWKWAAAGFAAALVVAGVSGRGRRRLRERVRALDPNVPAAPELPCERRSRRAERQFPAGPDHPKPSTPAR
jgi:hypothetical protein